MSKTIAGLALLLFTSASMAAEPACTEYDKLRSERDRALQAKDVKAYCAALGGLVKLMPAQPPETARLQCEAKANKMNVNTWLGIRPDVLSTMKTTFDEHCR